MPVGAELRSAKSLFSPFAGHSYLPAVSGCSRSWLVPRRRVRRFVQLRLRLQRCQHPSFQEPAKNPRAWGLFVGVGVCAVSAQSPHEVGVVERYPGCGERNGCLHLEPGAQLKGISPFSFIMKCGCFFFFKGLGVSHSCVLGCLGWLKDSGAHFRSARGHSQGLNSHMPGTKYLSVKSRSGTPT